MSDRGLNRRIPANRRTRSPHPSSSPTPSSSPSRHRRSPPSARRQWWKLSSPLKIIERSNSEPALRREEIVVVAAACHDSHWNLTPPDAVLFRPQTLADVYHPDELLPQSTREFEERYNKDAKVVVNVTVEGSPGAIQMLVKLGSSVEETIRCVISKYTKEGRTPRLDNNSTFELHHSYFSLQSMNKSELIGDVGGRSFYLRKTKTATATGDNCSSDIGAAGATSGSFISGVTPATPSPLLLFLPSFITRKISKIMRRTRKLWKIMGCMHCNA